MLDFIMGYVASTGAAVLGVLVAGCMALCAGLIPKMKVVNTEVGEARKKIDSYDESFASKKLDESLTHDNAGLTDIFYDLVTDFYEWGWGQSFHFATRYSGETFKESIARHEYWLASQLQMKSTDKVLDLGCGVGGPLRSIAKFTGAHITGITINNYQIKRANRLTPDYLKPRVKYVQGDFSKLPFEPESFDKVFAIEALCHMFEREKPFGEAMKVLKPGGLVGSYDWLMTDKFDPKNREHLRIKRGIEHGNSLPDIQTIPECLERIKKAGFEVLYHGDLAVEAKKQFGAGNVTWYHALTAGTDFFTGFLRSTQGRYFTRTMLNVLESIGAAPSGSVKTSDMLEDAAVSLVEGGDTEIFTPMYFFLCRKPLK